MRNLLLSLSLILIMLSESRPGYVTALSEQKVSSKEEPPQEEPAPSAAKQAVDLRTATGKTIPFQEPDQEESSAPDKIPHLVLNRNGVPTPGFERTLIVMLNDLSVPQSGMNVQVVIETQHKDPDLDQKTSTRIQIWKETRFIHYDPRLQQTGNVQFTMTFDPAMKLSHETIRTPTDYFRYQITVSDAEGNRLRNYIKDYAFLMENQWRVPLPKVLESSAGAAPDELLVYYYDMIPFQTHFGNPDTQIPRQEVGRYIQTELIPQMVKAFETQTNLWELPWHKEWSNYRVDEEPKTLSVALGGNGTWFHGSAPSLGHAMISIRVDGTFGEYSTLTDGIMSVFHHELFHNQQRNLSFHFRGTGSVSGKDQAWKLFTEGTAVLASSVAQPDVQFDEMAHSRSYIKRANAFIGFEGTIGGGLNKSYKEIPYHTALYWRFLYENCGGIIPGGEDPAAGMKVIRHALETLYKGEVVQIDSSTDVAGAFPRVMDHALQLTPSCKFQDYEESLVHFARAIYQLRLQNGRCPDQIGISDCGFVDPKHLYQRPPVEDYVLAAEQQMEIRGAIPSSYGIDLSELELDPSIQGKNLQLVFTSPAESSLEFHVEVWKTRTILDDTGAERELVQIGEPLSAVTADGLLVVELESTDSSQFDSLGLIITRMDPYEEVEAGGTYSIKLLAK